MSEEKHIAVLTGDLVGSVALGPEKVELAMKALEDAATEMEEWVGTPLRFTRHRGDGWQVVLEQPKYTIRAALVFRAALKSLGKQYDSYIGFAEGLTNTKIPKNLNEATGKVYTASGHTLEGLKRTKLPHQMGYMLASSQNAFALMVDHISQEWSQTQSELMIEFLHPVNELSFSELADKFKKSRQSVTKSITAAAGLSIIIALGDNELEYSNA